MLPLSHPEAVEQVFSGEVVRSEGYCEVPTSLFVDNGEVKMPELPHLVFYKREGKKFEALKIAGKSSSYQQIAAFPSVWIKATDFQEVHDLAETLLKRATTDANIPVEKRVELLQRTAIKTMDDLFRAPSPENINKSVKVVGSFVYLLMKDPKAYLMLSSLSNHDPYTLRHSVGTAVHAIILAKKFGFSNEEELNIAGLAGLLHDIGKIKVNTAIINKQGPLDELEWEEMRGHAQAGYEIVKDNPTVPERVKRAILEHHEERNGTGYPLHKRHSEIDVLSRIVGICDIFNALTTDRSYSKARSPLEAFQLMKDKLPHKFDEQLFMELVRIYGGQV